MEPVGGAFCAPSKSLWETCFPFSIGTAGFTGRVFFNQEQLFEAEDTTFSKPGKVGLWTKADSVTYFDDFTVVSKEAHR